MFGRERSSRKALRKLVADEEYDAIVRELESTPKLITELLEMIEDQSGDIGENAAHAIAFLGHDDERAPAPILEITPRLLELLKHDSRLTRYNAVMLVYELASQLLWEDCEERVRPYIQQVAKLLQDTDEEVREWATATIQAIAELIEDRSRDYRDLRDVVPTLRKLLRDRASAPAAIAALRAIAHREPTWIRSTLADLLDVIPHEKDFANMNAASLLSYLAEHDPDCVRTAETALRKLLADPWERTQEPAAIAMGFLGLDTEDGTVERILTTYVGGSREYRRDTAARALQNLSERRLAEA